MTGEKLPVESRHKPRFAVILFECIFDKNTRGLDLERNVQAGMSWLMEVPFWISVVSSTLWLETDENLTKYESPWMRMVTSSD